jgi:hypothetical protein
MKATLFVMAARHHGLGKASRRSASGNVMTIESNGSPPADKELVAAMTRRAIVEALDGKSAGRRGTSTGGRYQP